MDYSNEFIAFWGSIASLIALTLTLIGFLYGFYRWVKKRNDEDFSELETMREIVASHARSATTQGKRVDVFIYYQSVLSSRRHSHTLLEITAYFMHLVSILFAILVMLLPENPPDVIIRRYRIDYSDTFLYRFTDQNVHHIFLVLLVLLGALNIRVRRIINKQRRRINAISDALNAEFRDSIIRKLNTEELKDSTNRRLEEKIPS